MKDYKEITNSLLDRISKLYEFTTEGYAAELQKEADETGGYSWDFGKRKLSEIFLNTQNLISEDKSEEALVSLYDYFGDLSADASNITAEDIRNGNVKYKLTLIEILSDIVAEYDSWKENLYQKDLDTLNLHPFFEGDKLIAEEIDPSIYLYVNKVIKKKLFKSYVYNGGGDELYINDKFYIYPQVVVSESLQEWFHFLKKQNEYTNNIKDKVVVTLFLKLDNIAPEYSSFLISFHKGNSIWLSSDALSFKNPHNKSAQAGRNPGKRREEYYDNIALPYHIAFNLDELRTENSGLVGADFIETIDVPDEIKNLTGKFWRSNDDEKQGLILECAELCNKFLENKGMKSNSHDASYSHFKIEYITLKFEGRNVAVLNVSDETITLYKKPEILFTNFKDLHKLEKVYFIRLVESLIADIALNPPQQTAMLSSEFLDQKLLTGGDFNPQEHKFSHYGETVEERVNEILESVEEKTTALATTNYSLVKTSHKYDANWLATPEALENIMKWTVMDDKREELQKAIDKLEEGRKEDYARLSEMLQDRYEEIVKLVFQAKDGSIKIEDFDTFSAESEGKNISFYHELNRSKKSVYDHRRSSHLDVGKTQYDKEYCMVCNNYYSLSVKRVQVRHYKQLMVVLGLKDRMELPPYFRSYRAHNMIPYVGNSILDNTHPYNRLKDPCSQDNANGMQFDVFCCKKCAKEFEKKYGKGNHVTYDDKGSILEVLEEKPELHYVGHLI